MSPSASVSSAAATSSTSASPSGSASATSATAATLEAYVASSPQAGTSTSTASPVELCVSVERAQPSIKRGQTATYVVQVSTKNGSAAGVSVTLTAQPSSLKPEFTSGCAKGDGTASCSVGPVTTQPPLSLDTRIAVASNATSVTSVKLTATARVATTAKWTPPAAAETTSVTSASAAQSPAPASAAGALGVLPLGPIPSLNGAASLLIGAGNASGLFPKISAAPGLGPDPSVHAQPSTQNTAPLSGASPVSADTRVSTAQVAGLIALGLAIMLTVTRLAVRKRSRPSGPRGGPPSS